MESGEFAPQQRRKEGPKPEKGEVARRRGRWVNSSSRWDGVKGGGGSESVKCLSSCSRKQRNRPSRLLRLDQVCGAVTRSLCTSFSFAALPLSSNTLLWSAQGLYRRLNEYAEHFLSLCRQEFQAEQDAVRVIREERSLDYLHKEGLVLLGMCAVDGGEFFSDRIVSFSMAGNETLPKQLRFTQGDLLDISRGGETVSGTMLERNSMSLKVVLESPDVDVTGTRWRIDQGSNSITFERLCAALEGVLVTGKVANPDEVVNLICSSFNPQLVLETRKLLQSGRAAVVARMDGETSGIEEQAKQLPPSCTKKTRQQAAAVVKDIKLLSQVQKKAMKEALCRRLTLIQGPPGTGKTKTACATVRSLVQMNRGPILATAASNTAVDNMLEGLAGLKVVRIGRAVSTRQSLRWLTLEARVGKSGPVADLTKRLRSAEKQKNASAIRSVRAALREAEKRAARKIILNADVIVTTCTSSGSDLLEAVTIPTVVVDEATQATEPATLLPILRGCEQLILVGDHHQLPPTVVSKEATESGLDVSLFSRLWALGITPFLLNIQYRMHPFINHFPADAFYGKKVTSFVKNEDRPEPSTIPWNRKDRPVLFISVEATEERRGTSYANISEATAIARLVKQALKDKSLSAEKIGIVTPYAGQVQAISRALDSFKIAASGIEICSVDGFQGREKELILMSTVRANEAYKMGFTKDWRRLNVALTRARRGLVVVGNERTLSSDGVWREWILFVRKNNCILKGSALPNYCDLSDPEPLNV